jgi:hypothetical protein
MPRLRPARLAPAAVTRVVGLVVALVAIVVALLPQVTPASTAAVTVPATVIGKVKVIITGAHLMQLIHRLAPDGVTIISSSVWVQGHSHSSHIYVRVGTGQTITCHWHGSSAHHSHPATVYQCDHVNQRGTNAAIAISTHQL